ncbi:uncharacterized protein V6R79_023797 [Siganus canaliculatus]
MTDGLQERDGERTENTAAEGGLCQTSSSVNKQQQKQRVIFKVSLEAHDEKRRNQSGASSSTTTTTTNTASSIVPSGSSPPPDHAGEEPGGCVFISDWIISQKCPV